MTLNQEVRAKGDEVWDQCLLEWGHQVEKDIVEAPKDLCAKTGEGLDKDGGLNGHME